jgi:hypothetical protein
LRSLVSEPSWGPWRGPPRGDARERVVGVIGGRRRPSARGGTRGHVHRDFCPVERPRRSRFRRPRGFIWGSIRSPGTAAPVGGKRRSCTLEFLFTGGGPGGAVVDVGVARSERIGSRDLGRGGNRGSRRQGFVTIEVQGIAPLLDLGGANRTRRQWSTDPHADYWPDRGQRGANRTRRQWSTVQEKAANRGWSRRKLPHQKSLRPRNSSGSLTS